MTVKHRDVLKDLLYLDTFRGSDSTGVAAIRLNGDTHTIKSTVPGYEFIEGNRLEQHLKVTDFCWIGHNRFGTIGKNVKSNAHPFDILDDDGGCVVVGAHNGTLKNKYVLDDHVKFGTDSEAMFNGIAFNGLQQTIEKLEGAWALTYYDHENEELRFLRNKERPLYYAYEKGKSTIIWASEAWMIRIACQRRGIELEGDIIACEEDTLYRFPAPDKKNDVITVEIKGGLVGKQASDFFLRGTWERTGGTYSRPQQETTPTPPPQTGSPILIPPGSTAISKLPSGTTQGSVGEKPTSPSDSSSKKTPSSEAAEGADTQNNVTPISAAKMYRGYGGKPLTKNEISEALDEGCKWCETEFMTVGSRHAWLDDGHAVCAKCLDGTHEEEKNLLKTFH